MLAYAKIFMISAALAVYWAGCTTVAWSGQRIMITLGLSTVWTNSTDVHTARGLLYAGGSAGDQAEAATLAAGFKALSDPARLRLISLVAAHADQEACVCDLTEPVGLSQPTVSHHLKVLVEAGILTREQRGEVGLLQARAGHLGHVGQIDCLSPCACIQGSW